MNMTNADESESLNLHAQEQDHYACRVRLDSTDKYLIYYQKDKADGFVRTLGHRLLILKSEQALSGAALELGLILVPNETTDYDFDRLRAWCGSPTSETVECPTFLDAWNFFDDLAGLQQDPGTRYACLSRASSETYNKLFWGNNLPAFTPDGERFDPSWTARDLEEIRSVFEAGLELLTAEWTVCEQNA